MQTSEEQEFAETVEVIAGSPTEQELVAVIAVLEAASKQQAIARRPQRSTWAKSEQLLRTYPVAGNGQWRSSNKRGL